MKIGQQAQHIAAQIPKCLNIGGSHNFRPNLERIILMMIFQCGERSKHGVTYVLHTSVNVDDGALDRQQSSERGGKTGQRLLNHFVAFEYLTTSLNGNASHGFLRNY